MSGPQTAARDDQIRVHGPSPPRRNAGRKPNSPPLIGAELQDGTFDRGAQIRQMARLAHALTEIPDRDNRAEAAKFRSFRKY